MKAGPIPIDVIKTLRGEFSRNQKERAISYFFTALFVLLPLGLVIYHIFIGINLKEDASWLFYPLMLGMAAVGYLFIADLKSKVVFGEHEISYFTLSGKVQAMHKLELEKASVTSDRHKNLFLNLIGRSSELSFVIHDDLRKTLEKELKLIWHII